MTQFHPFLPLHPLQPGAMRGDGAAGLKKQILSSNSFAIAGDDQVWHWANARIKDDNVVVSSPEVENPVAVRYV